MHRHFKLYKPYGYISQFKSNAPKNKRQKFLGELYDFPEGTMAIGRLDEKSEGLLLLTTDGIQSDRVRSNDVEKEYYVQVDGEITEGAVKEMEKGVRIGIRGKDYITDPCVAKKIDEPNLPPRGRKIRDARHGPTSWISVIISEGKYRQVRKMTAAVGFPTLRLVRVRVGDEVLSDMQPSQVIEVHSFIP